MQSQLWTPPRTALILATTALLVAASVGLVVLVGDIGFQGDDWWIFSFPFWNSFPNALLDYAKESRRPIEGFYWISQFELFGFQRTAYHVCSLFLLAASAACMAAVLLRSFPNRPRLAVAAAVFAFLLPTIANLTYMIHTDNGRIASLLFWVSVLLFQRWAERSYTWSGLCAPVLLYCLSTLTYENTALLLTIVPLFLLPIVMRNQAAAMWPVFITRLAVGLVAGFVGFVLFRFAVFSGGAVGHRSLLPSPDLAVSYAETLGWYLSAPLTALSSDPWAWAWGLAVGTGFTYLLVRSGVPDGTSDHRRVTGCMDNSWYIALIGASILALGILPYMMAGYGTSVGFTSQSRIFSSGSFGVAILLAVPASIRFRRPQLRWCLTAATIAAAVLMAVFLADLRTGWKEAASKRDKLISSLMRVVPDVQPGTTFLFLDLQWYVARDAAVFQGVDGLGEFIKILYRKKDLYAYFLYPLGGYEDHSEERVASASPEGLMARGSAPRGFIPPDSVLILQRRGTEFTLLKGLSEEESTAAVQWNGVSEIRSNPELILPTSSKKSRLPSPSSIDDAAADKMAGFRLRECEFRSVAGRPFSMLLRKIEWLLEKGRRPCSPQFFGLW
jgi:hypothetical protein